MEDRVTELEIRITHYEDTLEVLNERIIEQQDIIDLMQHQIQILEKTHQGRGGFIAGGA